MRITIRILATIHGLFLAFLIAAASLEAGGDRVTLGITFGMMLADAFSVICTFCDPPSRWLTLFAVSSNAAAFAAPFVEAQVRSGEANGGEFAEGIGILFVTGLILPFLGPYVVNAVLQVLIQINGPPSPNQSVSAEK